MASQANVALDGVARRSGHPSTEYPELAGPNGGMQQPAGELVLLGAGVGHLSPSPSPIPEIVAQAGDGWWQQALDRWTAQLRLFREAHAAYTRSRLLHSQRRAALAQMSQRDAVPPLASSLSAAVAGADEETGEARLLPGPTNASLLSPLPVRRGGQLTTREREVVGLVARGLTDRQIADDLVLEPGTVANHVAHVLTKLDCRNRAQVAVGAVQTGLLASNAAALAPRGPGSGSS